MRELAPEQYARRVLFLVTGLSPQVITETVYALAVTSRPPFVPTEVHVLTTSEGAARARLTLLHPARPRFVALCQDYSLTGVTFDEGSIHLLNDHSGVALDDLRSVADNAAAADGICDWVRRFTADDACALHVSIAGGRKTMGFYAGYALSLFGRDQDRLSHVLVGEEFESNQDFYYPPVPSQVLFTRDNKPVNTADAQVTLAEIPFVRLRSELPSALLSGEGSFGAAVAALQARLAPPTLRLCREQLQAICGGTVVTFKPVDFAYYAWLARRCWAGKPPLHHTCVDLGEFHAEYRQVAGRQFERNQQSLRDGMTADFWNERKSRINQRLERTMGGQAKPYCISLAGSRPRQGQVLTLTPEQIDLGDLSS